MTVTYTAEVASSGLGTFLKLLRRWKGSVYKLLWKDFLIFVLLFYFINIIYRFALNEGQKRLFEQISRYCDAYNNLIPVAFVLGFYVSVILTRWWDQLTTIPWPDRMAIFVTASIHGHDERGRLMRRTIMRYCNLAMVLTFASISPPVKKRFPTLDHITDAGIMTKQEQEVFEHIKTPHNKYFLPLVWATSLVSRARKEMRIKDDQAQQTIMHEINQFRGGLGMLFNYDWLSMPLVYTQVVTLAVQTFFVSCLMGRQFLDPSQGYQDKLVDIYVPIFTFLQFFFYMGWLKVAESLTNPFGEDDDDFEVNTTIDRNMQVSYLIVDEMHSEHPDLIKDQYWDDVDFDLPYTAAAEQFKTDVYLGSTNELSVSPMDAEFVQPMDVIHEQDEEAPPVDEMTLPTDIPNTLNRTATVKHSPSSSRNRSRKVTNFLRRTLSRETSVSNRSGTSPRSLTSNRLHEEIFAMSDLNVSKPDDEHEGDEVTSMLTPRGSRRVPLSYKNTDSNTYLPFTESRLPEGRKSTSETAVPHDKSATDKMLSDPSGEFNDPSKVCHSDILIENKGGGL